MIFLLAHSINRQFRPIVTRFLRSVDTRFSHIILGIDPKLDPPSTLNTPSLIIFAALTVITIAPNLPFSARSQVTASTRFYVAAPKLGQAIRWPDEAAPQVNSIRLCLGGNMALLYNLRRIWCQDKKANNFDRFSKFHQGTMRADGGGANPVGDVMFARSTGNQFSIFAVRRYETVDQSGVCQWIGVSQIP
ncbi:MAG: hypothetical protein OXL37_16185 [Chloroflexota bacterium]|nr:hypothetical protein [Chloroflexota bacterium]